VVQSEAKFLFSNKIFT